MKWLAEKICMTSKSKEVKTFTEVTSIYTKYRKKLFRHTNKIISNVEIDFCSPRMHTEIGMVESAIKATKSFIIGTWKTEMTQLTR